MADLFLMNVLLLPHATFNWKLCKVWDASLFTSPTLPTYSCPQKCVLSYFCEPLYSQGCRTLMVNAQQIENASQALWPWVCLFMHLFISHVVDMNFRP